MGMHDIKHISKNITEHDILERRYIQVDRKLEYIKDGLEEGDVR